MKEYRNVSRVKFGLGYLPTIAISGGIFFVGQIRDNVWLVWAGLISLIVLYVLTTLVWRRVLVVGDTEQ